MIVRIAIAAMFLALPLPGMGQIPPPPSLPGQEQLTEQLIQAIETRDRSAYAALLADNVHVYEDGAEIAHDKIGWLAIFGKKLLAKDVVFKLSPGFSSTGRLLFIEYFNSVASWGGEVPAHCCWSYDAVAYDIADGKITAIRRLRGGDMRLKERRTPNK